jgi:hypothetical protein
VTLQTTLAGTGSTSPVPSVLLGAALLRRLIQANKDLPREEEDAQYTILTVTNAAAGGGTRSNTYFLINLLIPAPHASFNGGAVVSYGFRDQDGGYLGSGTLRYIFGYSKWPEPGLRQRQGESGYANYKDVPNKGKWVPIY